MSERDKSDICFKIFHHIQSSSDLSGELFYFNHPVSFFGECLQFHCTHIFMLPGATYNQLKFFSDEQKSQLHLRSITPENV
jgi:hypothetical protein